MNHRLLPWISTSRLALFLALGAFVNAQETVPLEEAQKIARKLASTVVVVSDLPFAVEVDSEKPAAIKGGDAGVLILPDKHLTADALAAVDKGYVPVAQLWAYKVTLVSGGSGFSSDKLRAVTVGEGEKTRQIQLFFLAVAKNAQGGLELAVFGKGNEPLQRVALQKSRLEKQELPIELAAEKSGEDSARLTLYLPGQYMTNLDAIKAD